MNTEKATVKPLNKVVLELAGGSSPDANDLNPQPNPYTFIYGLGTEGLSPFEFELAEKKEGDEISLSLSPNELSRVFEHLPVPFFHLPEPLEKLYLRGRILKVIPADNREVIKGLAAVASCDDCGCGCGGH